MSRPVADTAPAFLAVKECGCACEVIVQPEPSEVKRAMRNHRRHGCTVAVITVEEARPRLVRCPEHTALRKRLAQQRGEER